MQLIFRLLIELATSSLDIQACMKLRCVNRWARDQIVLKHRGLRKLVRETSHFFETPFQITLNQVLTSLRMGCGIYSPKAGNAGYHFHDNSRGDHLVQFLNDDDDDFVLRLTLGEYNTIGIERVMSDSNLFWKLWTKLCKDVHIGRSNVCMACILKKDGDQCESVPVFSLEGLPRMCLDCWDNRNDTCVIGKWHAERYASDFYLFEHTLG